MTENYRSARAIVDFSNRFVTRISQRMKTHPCVAVQNLIGTVQITRYQSENLVTPLVNQVIKTYHNERACVLTNTNDEAACIVGLLKKKGMNAKLIQSTDDFCRRKYDMNCRLGKKKVIVCKPPKSTILWLGRAGMRLKNPRLSCPNWS